MEDLTPILQVAYAVLNNFKGRQGHINEIAEAALRTNQTMGLDAAAFGSKLSGALSAHVKKKDAVFARVAGKKDAKGKVVSYKKGMYRLKQVRTSKPTEVNIAPQVDSAFLGKAGELAVMSELLFWGFNASLMVVDKGIDIVASKENLYYHIQVKTAQPRSNGTFGFSINLKSFENNHSGNTYYIFLMRESARSVFAVIPSSHITTLRNRGLIKGTDNLSVTLSVLDKGKKYLLNNKDDITTFINNFGQIK
jgi:hypothetical protein|nr:MAG TPA: putative endonuclease [Caudoviricetes sp.]